MWSGLTQLTQKLQEQAEGIARQAGLDEQLVSFSAFTPFSTHVGCMWIQACIHTVHTWRVSAFAPSSVHVGACGGSHVHACIHRALDEQLSTFLFLPLSLRMRVRSSCILTYIGASMNSWVFPLSLQIWAWGVVPHTWMASI